MSAVTWNDRAMDQFADIYVAASVEEREVLAREFEFINRRLAENALFEGESRGGYGRVFIRDMLLVFYTVIPNQPTRVLEVRANKRMRK